MSQRILNFKYAHKLIYYMAFCANIKVFALEYLAITCNSKIARTFKCDIVAQGAAKQLEVKV